MADPVSLADLLPDRLEALAERARATLSEDEQVAGMKLAWGYVGSQLQQALRSTLDIPLMEALARGWAAAAKIADYADPAKHPLGERSVIELGDHELTREFKPVIAVTIGSCPCFELDFTFAVSARFGGLKLAIADAHILGGETGDAWASGQLSLHGVPLHEPVESRKVALPGAVEFAPPGMPISFRRPA
jgi:hypothetical protein